jgi:NAD(P)-dependent dehydrogenase (short-subunit alcohol dehydrogenase family)
MRYPAQKTAIITGATRGIGKAISLVLAREKFNLVLNYHQDTASANRTLEECLRFTENVILFQADVSIESAVRNMVEETIRRFASIDVVVNNAGLNIDRSLMDLTVDEWDRVVDTNMKGTFIVSKEAAKYMLKQEAGGHIINISATTAIKGRKEGINYCASKAGIIVMTKCLALELGPRIRVNCVIPGFTYTEETESRFDLKRKLSEELEARKIPLGRMAKPEEIAGVIRLLLSSDGGYINGQKIIVDGGEFMF